MADNRIKVDKWININQLSKYTQGKNTGCIDWNSSIGNNIDFKYGDIEGTVIITKYDGKRVFFKYNGNEYSASSGNFKRGKIGVILGIGGNTKEIIEKQKIERVGEITYNKFDTKIEIVEYISEGKIKVRFNDNKLTDRYTSYREFKSDNKLCSVLDKSICGIGYIGIGKYSPTYIDINGNIHPTKEYDAWRSMIRRCYADLENCSSYKDVIVCKEWHNFQNFAKWYEDNYYQFRNEVMQVDKDILKHGNKEYSPDNCIIVPSCINAMFIKNKSKRGDCPIGVYKYGSKELPYTAQCADIDLGKQKRIGQFKTKEEAFYAYKEYKEKYLKRKAEEFKNEIPLKLYNAMINYEVKITD